MKLLSTAIAFAAATLIIAGTVDSDEAFAAAKRQRRFPHGCRHMGYGYKDGLLILKPIPNDSIKPKKTEMAANEEEQKPQRKPEKPPEVPIQTLYLIHNLSGNSIHLRTKKLPDVPFSPTHENTIRPNQWAALAVNQKELQFTCAMAGTGEMMDCTNMFELCQYNRAKFAAHNQGTYWVIKSGSRGQAKYGSIRNGILLKW